ncbi:MAG: HAD hydrolase family protein, partial [Acidobacteriaceae bacterium]|nr:HAD hydrolase family protein [Acidobacteriaceae bacterium]
LEQWAAARGMPAQQIMAIGDNLNDLEMLSLAGRPVVMANSAPALLEVATERGWEIAAGNDQDGVAQMLESILDAPSVQYREAAPLETLA